MFNDNPFRREGKENRNHRDDRDDKKKTSRGGSRASSRDNCKSPQSDITSRYQNRLGYLKPILSRFTDMPGLAEDVSIIIPKLLDHLRRLRESNASLNGGAKIGGYIEKLEKHLKKYPYRKIVEHVKNTEKDLKEERLVLEEGGITAYEKAFKEANGCSPEMWETTRTMKKIENDLKLTVDQYGKILQTHDCQKNSNKTEVVNELISKSMELKATHERARSILAKDNPQKQSSELRSYTPVPQPNNTGNSTRRARKPLPGSS
ncbi:uncharacterized protein EAE97_002520 [Botrytis byssoidea]|uniref:Uncharacterized protein n=1 Tax=Botrytis byssoidea TaxID=139641 RepID=A0A9P5IU25_9HELO|nr:uncharacterized protein EAE97_002520 [Botrytis byssoidea]KAF7950968.1 hypothetical protein EAE97_002520 [Botrytis byssoidea]